jgi:hypothetical protein
MHLADAVSQMVPATQSSEEAQLSRHDDAAHLEVVQSWLSH